MNYYYVIYLWLWATMESTITKNAGKLMTILIPMLPGWYGVMHIAQWSASVASSKAREGARTLLPRRPPWSTILNETQKQ
jgi:hypothetical protein